MKKISRLSLLFYIFFCIIFLTEACFLYIKFLSVAVQSSVSDCVKIILDPGHGGLDPGKTGNYLDESYINLFITKELEMLLTKRGFIVILTREDEFGLCEEGSLNWDKNKDMALRKKIISSSDAELFISIHCNSFTDSTCRGAQVFYPDNDAQSMYLAEMIQSNLSDVSLFENKRVAMIKNDAMIINDNSIPSVLVECGFLSNLDEELLLNSEQYRSKIAFAIYKSICMYLCVEP